jgi:glucokinase
MPDLQAEADKRRVLGLDFGGTTLAAGIVDLVSPRLVDAGLVGTRPKAGAPGAVADMTKLAKKLKGVDSIDDIGVCFGGHVYRGRILRSMHIEGWEDLQLGDHLASHFGPKEIRIANDANAVALGEWRFGAGRGTSSTIYVTVSTGIGGGLILGGELYDGVIGMAGEIGHMKVLPDGPLCTCGCYGCLEAVAAGPAIVKKALESRQTRPDIPSRIPQKNDLAVKEVAWLAEQGDELAKHVLREAGHYLGIGIANTINLLDVERVVIGGGVSRAGGVWWEAVSETTQVEIMPQRSAVDIRLAELSKFGGVWGAAALFWNEAS